MPDPLTDKHILYLTRWYPHRDDPMFGLFTRNHAGVTAEWANVSVVYVHAVDYAGVKKRECSFNDEEGVFTWRIYYRAVSCRIPVLREFLKVFRFIRAIRYGIRKAWKRSGKPHLIHVHILTRLGVVALWYKWCYRIPFVVTEHWSRYLPSVSAYRGVIRKWLTQIVVRNAAAVTTPTLNLQKAMIDSGLNNPHYSLLPNLVDTERFTLSPRHKKNKESLKTIVHVSCFEDRSKNISGLLRVTGRLTKERNDFRVVFVGEGADYERMTELAGQTGLKDRVVFFAGLLEGEALVHSLQAADFMVISSHYENLPVVISEAFACGLPVLSTDVGGIAEILTKDRGKLVPPGEDGALLDGLRFMLDHYQDFHPEKIRDFAIDYCSREKVSKQLKALYYQALGIPWQ